MPDQQNRVVTHPAEEQSQPVTTSSRPATGPPSVAAATDWRLLLAVSITVLAWASAFVVIRYVGDDFSPGSLTLGRLLIGSAVLSVSMVGRRRVRLDRREWALVALIGVAWFGVYNVALNAGEQHVDAGTASMLIQVAPILIGVLAGVVLGEGFPRMLVIGGLVAFAGTLVIGIATSTGDADVSGRAPRPAQRRRCTPWRCWRRRSCSAGCPACRSPGWPAWSAPWPRCRSSARWCGEARVAPAASVLGVVYLGAVPTALWRSRPGRTRSAGRMPAGSG